MEPRTHLRADPRFCGTAIELSAGSARVALEAIDSMVVDAHGLIHGGFIFGLADYAAMLAVNQPNVVLGSAQARFLKPVVTGESLAAEATVVERDGRKQIVAVDVERAGELVFRGEFVCFIPDEHILDKPGR